MSASTDLDSPCGLGIDAGGTETRWAVALGDGTPVAEGSVGPITALQMATRAGREALEATIAALAREARTVARPARIVAGITGLGEDTAQVVALIAAAFGLQTACVEARTDIEIAYLGLFAPGEGYVVYAGTGSIAAYIDAAGGFHRAGGRGVLLDDAGGGFWIAREALRYVWRGEDEAPGRWKSSPLARALFDKIGGSDWAHSRRWIYGGERGDIGRLALAVAEKADADPVARTILEDAGRELARLCRALIDRYGARPIVVTGRAAHLHPLIYANLVAAMPPGTAIMLRESAPHHAAARIAAGRLAGQAAAEA